MSEPLVVITDEMRAQVAADTAAFAAQGPPPPTLDTRVAAVEADVADLDAIIVAVLT